MFLREFVGDIPWAHLDIAPTMKADADESWRSKGATGFGTRLLIELATRFTKHVLMPERRCKSAARRHGPTSKQAVQ